MTDNIQSVVIASCGKEEPETIVKLMLGEIPNKKEEEGITIYNWHISTKYYTADVRLCLIKGKTNFSSEFATSVEGIILFFDFDNPRGFDPINEWNNFLGPCEAEVKILVCRTCQPTSKSYLTKLKVQEWCVKEGFELVELEPPVDEWEIEQDFVETSGIERVVQALEAHVWPNLLLKERRDPTTMAGLLHGGFCKSTVTNHDSINTNDTNELTAENNITTSSDYSVRDQYVNRRAGDSIEPTEEELFSDVNTEFCHLFSQLPMMKERASAMPNEERKKFAENVVLAYWRAIGGDKDEILDC